MLEGGASVTVCTSEVERDVRELSGTLDTGGPTGVVPEVLADDTAGDGTRVALIIEDTGD